MSDPVTNVEIEDVLSSIRRLIADGDQPRAAPDPIPASPDTSTDAPAPLMLTPSLRIGDTGDDPLATARAVARIEGAVTAGNHEFEPDGSEITPHGADSAAGDTLPVFRTRERTTIAPPADTPVPATGDAPPQGAALESTWDDDLAPEDDAEADDSALALLDADQLPEEQILRDLIAEILRDELAGGLGERITRNVRKLVRREIHRVLDSRDME